MTQIQRHQAGGAIMQPGHVDNSDIQILDRHSGEMREHSGRVDTIATVSLGYKTKGAGNFSIPVSTKKKDAQWLHIHGAEEAEAPQLYKALTNGEGRRLVISLAGDTWPDFVQQHYALYSASRLQVYGDDQALTYIHAQPVLDREGNPVYVTDQNGQPVIDQKTKRPRVRTEPVHITKRKRGGDQEESDSYARMLKVCKPQIDIYFHLAEWHEEPLESGNWVPRIVFDGDVGCYRLRTTSHHTLDNLASTVKQVRALTGGPLRGVPLTLSAAFPEVAGDDGQKRVVPVATFRLQPPYLVTGQVMAPMLQAGVEEGQALALPAPRPQTIEDAIAEADIEDDGAETSGVREPSERELGLIMRGQPANVARYSRFYFGVVGDSEYRTDEGRGALVKKYTEGQTSSLSEFLQWSTDEEARAFIDWVDTVINGRGDPGPSIGGRRTSEVKPSLPADEYERTYGKSYGEGQALDAADVAAIATGQPVASIRERQRVQTQPDGSSVNVDSGEIVKEAPAPTPTPAPAAEPPSSEAPSSPNSSEATPSGDDSASLEEEGEADQPPDRDIADILGLADEHGAEPLPGFGDAPGIAPATAAAAPDPSELDPKAEALFPDPPVTDEEVVDLDMCRQMHAQGRRLGIEIEAPSAKWKAAELRSYHRTLGDMIRAAERKKEEALPE